MHNTAGLKGCYMLQANPGMAAKHAAAAARKTAEAAERSNWTHAERQPQGAPHNSVAGSMGNKKSRSASQSKLSAFEVINTAPICSSLPFASEHESCNRVLQSTCSVLHRKWRHSLVHVIAGTLNPEQ